LKKAVALLDYFKFNLHTEERCFVVVVEADGAKYAYPFIIVYIGAPIPYEDEGLY